jgi:uncharacterized membrane protein YjfL (UPF0719 family)
MTQPIAEFLSSIATQWGFVILEVLLGFALLWLGHQGYQRLVLRLNLAEELFVRDNPAVAVAIAGFDLGVVLALGSIFPVTGGGLGTGLGAGQLTGQLGLTIGLSAILAVVLMLAGALLSHRFLLRRFNSRQELLTERNLAIGAIEAGFHVANGLIISHAWAGDGGPGVGLICWLLAVVILVGVSQVYGRVAAFDLRGELCERNNLAVGLAFAGLLVGVGNVGRSALSANFDGWLSFAGYGLNLGIGLAMLLGVRVLADLLLVPGAKFSDETTRQTIPNVGAGLLEGMAYVTGSMLISWGLIGP